MIPFETLTLFFGASVMLALAPGPDNIFVLTQSAMNGRVAGLFVTLGLCTGLLFHTTAVALGVAAIFQTSEIAFTLLKFAGAGYLLYLAYKAFRAGSSKIEGERAETSLKSLYLRGLIMNITNRCDLFPCLPAAIRQTGIRAADPATDDPWRGHGAIHDPGVRQRRPWRGFAWRLAESPPFGSDLDQPCRRSCFCGPGSETDHSAALTSSL